MDHLDLQARISLFGLLHELYRNKTLLLLSSLLGLVIGFAVIFFSEPVYEAKIRINAPNEGGIAPLNIGRTGKDPVLKPILLADAYYIFRNALLSDAVKTEFFKRFYQLDFQKMQNKPLSVEQLRASLAHNLAVVENPQALGDKYIHYTVAIRGHNPKQVAQWLAEYINLAQKHALQAVLKMTRQQTAVLLAHTQQKINIARTQAKQQRLDRIVQLKEKIHLAQWEDMNDDLMMDNEPYPDNPARLRAEIKNLSERKSDDAFIPGLRFMQAQVQFYNSLKINTNNVRLYRLDGMIEIPDYPIAPRKRLILMVYLAIGFLVGVLGVMFQIALKTSSS
ncbi:MAG: Wzz/FepE/Etk N-terminal domain-containing protein [Legionella sp.]|uniref:Wzz/FepE/Etk N-terminal domain-containing protein n=1 Tax=Legionella sp. TaxID=459 RepID=UPI0039E5BA22